ncbi:MAG TPA: hypothetical protein VHH73_12890 [Verrucomicrobiae bacterium]|nr:hypothetical protein [Verrucomicrobiae bacterium]
MNPFIIVGLSLLGGIALFAHQLVARNQAEWQRLHLQGDISRASAGLSGNTALHANLRERLQNARQYPGTTSPISSAEIVVPADPARNGGWPDGVGYFYLPKRDLESVGVKGGFFSGKNHLTDAAVTLYGISPEERGAVDQALDTLVSQCGALESARLEPVDLPKIFEKDIQDAVVRRIPAFTNEMATLRSELNATLAATLGPQRAGYFAIPLNDFFQNQLAGIGLIPRTVIFGKAADSDQQVFAWTVGEPMQNGMSQKLDPNSMPPSSVSLYRYARLLGVKIPDPGEWE